jgi:hypothetical protein
VRELEIAAVDSLGPLAKGSPRGAPPLVATCPNCQTPLQGPYCHACGQSADIHKRSIIRLVAESVEGLFHLDGRLRRTLPDLFFRPGRLARDYMDGRIARHVPPFRTFLVALLLFVFAAEYATHGLGALANADNPARPAVLVDPKARAQAALEMRAAAWRERLADVKEAENDRAESLKDPDEKRAEVEARYKKATDLVQAAFMTQMAVAARIERGQPPGPKVIINAAQGPAAGHWRQALQKAIANPEYYLTVLFAWGHRAAFLLLPIVALALAAAYFYRRRFFFYDHLIVAMNFLSFVFLANAIGFVLPLAAMGWWLLAVWLWTPVNLFQTLRGAYGSSIIGAVVKTFFVWNVAFVSFVVLLAGLMIFTLGQL